MAQFNTGPLLYLKNMSNHQMNTTSWTASGSNGIVLDAELEYSKLLEKLLKNREFRLIVVSFIDEICRLTGGLVSTGSVLNIYYKFCDKPMNLGNNLDYELSCLSVDLKDSVFIVYDGSSKFRNLDNSFINFKHQVDLADPNSIDNMAKAINKWRHMPRLITNDVEPSSFFKNALGKTPDEYINPNEFEYITRYWPVPTAREVAVHKLLEQYKSTKKKRRHFLFWK
jgi:hypothetical protein